jgi:hypothetical protein
VCLLHCCAMSMAVTTENTALLLLCWLPSTGMSLPSCCLAVNYSGIEASCHIASSLTLFIPNGLQAYCHSFFSEGCTWFHLLSCGLVFLRCLLCNRSHCSLLKSGSLVRCWSLQVYHHHHVFPIGGGKIT